MGRHFTSEVQKSEVLNLYESIFETRKLIDNFVSQDPITTYYTIEKQNQKTLFPWNVTTIT